VADSTSSVAASRTAVAGILLGRDRRALHDVIAGTTVVYDWDAREARIRSLARKGSGRRP
jgi:uncharacterized RDD family membrane protein YckC